MRLDQKLQHKLRSGHSVGIDLNSDGTVAGFKRGWGKSPYPPPGYAPWNIFDVGNGDTYGFYWPIGKESSLPIVCTTMHDSADLYPVASSFERAVQLLAAAGRVLDDEIAEIAQRFGIQTAITAAPELDCSVPFWGRRAEDLFEIDDNSPSILLAMAANSRREGDLNAAQRFIDRSLEILPEHADGWYMLAELRRQSRDSSEYARAAVRALTAPCAFGTFNRRKLLESIQRLPETASAENADPFWVRRKDFTMAQGVFESPDLQLMREAIEEYHGLGQHIRAVYLRIVSGEWMKTQTVSFQERSNWSWDKYRTELRQDHEMAGLTSRLVAL